MEFGGSLPEGIRIMNPFQENPSARETSERFYKKFYDDHRKRHLILGINPGRHGAGVTGVPFTDTKRLESKCGLTIDGLQTHEPSSVFVYELIDACGGVEVFYHDFYITSICPLGFVKVNDKGKEVNYNYYDSKALTEAVLPFMEWSLRTQLEFGINTDVAFVLGTGKNFQFIEKMNQELGLFGKLVGLEHPRFVMQYRSKEKESYVRRFVQLLKPNHFKD
ncbi:MAG: uracil-DNA glycosylase family protein [Saprospiraceae bacterium]